MFHKIILLHLFKQVDRCLLKNGWRRYQVSFLSGNWKEECICGSDTQAFNSHGDILSYLLVWQYEIFQLHQVTAFSTLHQHEGSLPMDTLPAVDSLCVLSLFQVERFIGKLARLAASQLICESTRVSISDPLVK